MWRVIDKANGDPSLTAVCVNVVAWGERNAATFRDVLSADLASNGEVAGDVQSDSLGWGGFHGDMVPQGHRCVKSVRGAPFTYSTMGMRGHLGAGACGAGAGGGLA